MPREKLVKPRRGVVGNSRQYVSEPGLRIDVVEFCCGDEAVYRRRPLAAAVGAGEKLGAAPERDTAQGALRCIIGQADAAVVEEAGEGRPARQHIIDGLGGLGMA